MKKLCLGSLLKILCYSRKANTKQYAFLNSLLSTVQNDSRYSDDKFQSALLSGKNNLTDYEDILTCDKDNLVAAFKNKIVPYFDEDNQRNIIICIREILREDDVKDHVIIGYEAEGYTKQDIINMQVFPFADFLANVYYYCTTSVKNIPYKDNIKEITKEFVEAQKEHIDDIKLETKASFVHSKLKMTLDPKPFKDVFIDSSSAKLCIPNNSDLKIFLLDVVNSKIDYAKLEDFITDNIGRYIYSRAMRNSYNVDGRSDRLAFKAISAYKKRVAKDPSTNQFNEIMLYSFLECVLGAPKIFSKMELQDKSGLYYSTSSGIHLLSLKQGGLPFNQLVFGATDSINDLATAIDNAFKQVVEIKNSAKEEYDFLETTILNNEFDSETNKTLEDIIIPKKGSGLTKPDSAFGMFIGYNVDVPDEPNNEQFKINIKAKMESDIKSFAPYIENKITSLGLSSYSFYIYILPFNDINIDKDQIMRNALEVDD